MDRFLDEYEQLRQKHFSSNWSYKQDRHSASVFLVMNNPEFHYAYVYNRIGTKVRLLGQPSEKIEILDDFRNK